jgi:hypothetical protein
VTAADGPAALAEVTQLLATHRVWERFAVAE